jgi:hypothetical protein
VSESPCRGQDAKSLARTARARRVLLAVLVVATLGVALAAFGAVSTRAAGTETPDPNALPLEVGDVIEVTGTRVGCKVTMRSGARTLDCRRAGNLTGTYGALLTSRRVLVVKFTSEKVARVVFSARHLGKAVACGPARSC